MKLEPELLVVRMGRLFCRPGCITDFASLAKKNLESLSVSTLGVWWPKSDLVGLTARNGEVD